MRVNVSGMTMIKYAPMKNRMPMCPAMRIDVSPPTAADPTAAFAARRKVPTGMLVTMTIVMTRRTWLRVRTVVASKANTTI